MKKLFNNIAGLSLAMILVVMTILTALGLGIMSNTIKNLTLSDTISDSEKAYYSAEDAAQIAIATIKKEVTAYYTIMRKSNNYSTYLLLYNNFFNYLEDRLTGDSSILLSPEFISGQLDDDISIICSMDNPSTQASGYLGTTFNISCASLVDETPRIIYASIKVEAAPLVFQYTSAPILSSDMLILGGNVEINKESDENSIIVNGTARIGGSITDFDAFSTTGGAQTNDYTVEDDLVWSLYYNQFDTSIINPSMPPIVTASSASNKYDFYTDTTITKKVTGKNVYCDGDLTLADVEVNNCNIYVTGDFYLLNSGDADRLKGTNIHAEGDMIINTSNFWVNQNHPTYFYSGGDISIILGQGGTSTSNKSGIIQYSHFTSIGNISITSAYEDDLHDIIEHSSFFAGGSILLDSDSYLSGPRIDTINNTTFETLNGDITLVSSYMHSNNKIHARGNVTIANKGMSDTEVYADGNILFEGTHMYSNTSTGYYSSNTKICAQDDLTIRNASFKDSYFYSGDNVIIDMVSGYSIESSIIYSENDAAYTNEWYGEYETMVSSLIYTNADFYYTGRGTNITYEGIGTLPPAGMQVMAKGNMYSYENDDSLTYGYIGYIFKPELDILNFGYGDSFDIDTIHNLVGVPDSIRGLLASNLYDAGFEHDLPEPIVKLPLYTEVFKSENISEN